MKYWNERISKLAFQGNFIQLPIEEKQNIAWKSIIIFFIINSLYRITFNLGAVHILCQPKMGWSRSPLPPLSAKNQKLAYPPSPPCQKKSEIS